MFDKFEAIKITQDQQLNLRGGTDSANNKSEKYKDGGNKIHKIYSTPPVRTQQIEEVQN